MSKKFIAIIIVLLIVFFIYPDDDNKLGRIIYSKNEEICISLPGEKKETHITKGHHDMKPSWSKTGNMIVFFRVTAFTDNVETWNTAICIINADGTGFKKITSGFFTDYNPTWTRDGTNRIIFSRYNSKIKRSSIYITTIEAKPGEEILVSDRKCSEYALSSLKDGRIFIISSRKPSISLYFLFDPKSKKYEPVKFNFQLKGFLDRASINPGETKITYEYKNGWQSFVYLGKVIYVADFNKDLLTIDNPIPITDEENIANIYTLYPRWTSDGSSVVYHCSKTGKNQIYLYNLSDKTTLLISVDEGANYQFPCGESTPK